MGQHVGLVSSYLLKKKLPSFGLCLQAKTCEKMHELEMIREEVTKLESSSLQEAWAEGRA